MLQEIIDMLRNDERKTQTEERMRQQFVKNAWKRLKTVLRLLK